MERGNPKLLYGCRCTICPFSRHGLPHQPVLGEGPVSARGVMLGEGPGRDEAERGLPFVGPTGRELDDLLLQVKLKRADLFLLNSMCCPPTMGKTLADMKKATECCRPAVIGQLSKLRNEFHVFAMGKWASFSITGSAKGLKKGRGFLDKWSLEMTVAFEKVVRLKLKKARIKNDKTSKGPRAATGGEESNS